MHNRSNIGRHIAVFALIALALQGCGRIRAMSRVDPLTIAVYPGGKNPGETGNSLDKDKPKRSATGKNTDVAAKDQCNLIEGAGGYFPGAIDLDCFKFPEDRHGDLNKGVLIVDNSGGPPPPTSTSTSAQAPAPTTATGAKGKTGKVSNTGASAPATRAKPSPPAAPAVATYCSRMAGEGMLAYTRAAYCKRDRNRLTALLLKHSDDICIREMGSLTADQATTHATLDILSTAATTAANIVTGEQAKSILAGAGTLGTASRSHIVADIYRNTVAYAVSRAIYLERKRLRDLIEARYGQDVDIFTVDDAIRAANEYHGVCSFYRGLELVLASVEGDQRARDAQERREKIEALEQQITHYRALLANKAPAEDAKIYTDKIKELLDQIQQLTLATIPSDQKPTSTPAKDPKTGDSGQSGTPGGTTPDKSSTGGADGSGTDAQK